MQVLKIKLGLLFFVYACLLSRLVISVLLFKKWFCFLLTIVLNLNLKWTDHLTQYITIGKRKCKKKCFVTLLLYTLTTIIFMEPIDQKITFQVSVLFCFCFFTPMCVVQELFVIIILGFQADV